MLITPTLLAASLLALPAWSLTAGETTSNIHPQSDTTKCLAVSEATAGSTVQLLDCGDSTGQLVWDAPSKGDKGGAVQLTGTSLCLDSGPLATVNANTLTIATCDSSEQQDWVYSEDGNLAVATYCLATTDQASDGLSLTDCSSSDPTQEWVVNVLAVQAAVHGH